MTDNTQDCRRIALVDDDDDLLRSMDQLLSLSGFEVTCFTSAAEALGAIDESWPGIVVTDVRMPHMSGIELFRRLNTLDADLPVVLITGHGDVDMAVDLIKSGAWDFLSKPYDPDALIAAATRAATARSLSLENRRLRSLASEENATTLIGESPAIRRLREMVPVLAGTDIDILIEGETGTGKDLLARLIHRSGRHARHRFLPVACAGMSEALVAQTFGPSPNPALLSADRGTLYLDDIDRAPAVLQDRLLAFVERRVLRQGDNLVPIDVRIIATSQPSGDGGTPAISPPLFFRLAAMRLSLPPLRERREDIAPLFARFVADAAQRFGREIPPVTAPIRTRLETYEWPGNVRELQNFAEQFVMDLVTPATSAPAAETRDVGLVERVDAYERDVIIAAVVAAKGEIGAAISALQLPRKTFYYKVHKHGIDLAALRQNLS